MSAAVNRSVKELSRQYSNLHFVNCGDALLTEVTAMLLALPGELLSCARGDARNTPTSLAKGFR